MAPSEPMFPECCRYCPHRASVKGTCDHDARQSLAQAFTDADAAERPCPIFDDVRAGAMAELSERLDDAGHGPSE